MLILEPILNETQFISFSLKTSLLQFSDLFDISRFNSVSVSKKFVQLGSQDHFYKNAPRKVIYVNSRRSRQFEGTKPLLLYILQVKKMIATLKFTFQMVFVWFVSLI